jgi:hypothetical protein
MLMGMMFVGGLAGFGVGGWMAVIPGAALFAGVSGAILWLSWFSSIEITPRWVTVDSRGYGGAFKVRLALSDIRRVVVARHKDDHSGFYLVVDDGDEQYLCFSGLPEDDLRYICARVEDARSMSERRQDVEGREYGFEQVPPKEISELAER